MSTYVIQSSLSTLEIEAMTNLFPIHGRASELIGEFEAQFEDGKLSLAPMPYMRIVVPVSQLVSGNDALDREMRSLVSSQREPNIVAYLRQLRPLGDDGHFHAVGEISIRGSMQSYEGDLSVRLTGERVMISGEQRMDIRRFALTPPRVPFFKIEPDFLVRFRVTADKEG